MLIVTTDGVPGCEIRAVFGEVFGVSVQADQSRSSGQSSGTFRMTGDQPIGLAKTRREAMDRLAEEARRRGANAVVGMRFDNTPLGAGGHEVCAYGTAVVAEAVTDAARRQHETPQHQAPQPGYPGEAPAGRPPMVARNLTIGLHDERGDRHR
ncbi:YbjQ family protein [Actinomadura sp. HBU206391]|uniref:YbjQ family protein n=1 Tax=Actinomadura sp. HBU206391 TaxID=2731692 RepID=UPI00164F379C|nr:heavy metal-binding domain-containing protein [Actinomadura sp. HBU206391]MBC6461283.1 heavy metal-binding domain-containing protein [Actinomadura sp. HBU206391]